MTPRQSSLKRAIRNAQSLVWESSCVPSPVGRNAVEGGLLRELGYSHVEWLSAPTLWLDIMHADDRRDLLARLGTEAGVTRHTAEFRWLRRDERPIWVRADLWLRRAAGGNIREMRGVAFDVTEYHEREQHLLESIRSRDQFMAMLAHEMRTPIGAILGWTTMLGDHLDDTTRVRVGLAAILRNAELQNRLVEDLLDLSRGLFGKLAIRKDVVSVEAVLAAAHTAVRPSATAKMVDVFVQVAPDLPNVIGDEARLVQVLTNLLANGVKFTPPGGSVSVHARAGAHSVEITVVDTGVGIEDVELDRLFEPFFQRVASRTRSAGLGLGLFVAKDIVERHGGEIAVESLGRDRGTRVSLRLPAAVERQGPRYRGAMESYDTGAEPDGKPSCTSLSLGA